MAKKLDNNIFIATVVVGIPIILFTIWQTGGFKTLELPIVGIIAVSVAHTFYEIHDEMPFFENLIAKGCPQIIFDLFN